MTDQTISLSTLLIPSKVVALEFPGYDDMTVELCYLAREELMKIRKKCITSKFNRKTHQPEEVLDEDKFLAEYVSSVIKGWSGFKYKYLQELVLADVSGLDPEGEFIFTLDNAQTLMRNSTTFENWVTDAIGDLENFTGNK